MVDHSVPTIPQTKRQLGWKHAADPQPILPALLRRSGDRRPLATATAVTRATADPWAGPALSARQAQPLAKVAWDRSVQRPEGPLARRRTERSQATFANGCACRALK